MTKTRGLRTHSCLLLLCAFAIFLTSCVSWLMEKPSFVLRRITVSPLSFTEMNLLVELEVQNANRFDLTLRSFECTIYLEEAAIGKGSLQKEILVPSLLITRMEVPIGVKLKDLGGSLKALLTGGALPPYRIEGVADVGTVFGSFKIPFSEEKPIRLGR